MKELIIILLCVFCAPLLFGFMAALFWVILNSWINILM